MSVDDLKTKVLSSIIQRAETAKQKMNEKIAEHDFVQHKVDIFTQEKNSLLSMLNFSATPELKAKYRGLLGKLSDASIMEHVLFCSVQDRISYCFKSDNMASFANYFLG